ncbi:MAG: hypothetical protein KDA68_13090 [Planctomycetaceae bacterium]|nr:hypothetical protein [Planctomycetaceae bacterium]
MNPDLNSKHSATPGTAGGWKTGQALQALIPLFVFLCYGSSLLFGITLTSQSSTLWAAQDAPAEPAVPSAADSAEEAARRAAESVDPAAAEPTAPAADADKPAADADPEIDPVKGFAPEFKIKDEWPLPDYNERKMRAQMLVILGSGKFNSPDDERLLELYIKFQVARLTQVSERAKLKYHKDTIIKQLRNSQPPLVPSYEVHDKYLDVLITELPKLFNNNIYVREAAAVILENMTLRDAPFVNPNARATPYLPAVHEMLALVRDKKQHPAVKFPAIRGLIRFFDDPSVSPNSRHDIIRAFLDELRREDRYPDPYLWRIISGLGDLGQIEDGNNRPTVAQELMLIIVDPTYSWRIRAVAARTLSRIPLESSKGPINLEVVTIELVRLARDMGDAQALEPELPHWKDTFIRLYFAFNPGKAEREAGEGILQQIKNRPPLAKFDNIANDAYQQILPLVNKVVFDAEDVDLDKQIEQMGKWLDEHPQKTDRISPDEDPILTAVKP